MIRRKALVLGLCLTVSACSEDGPAEPAANAANAANATNSANSMNSASSDAGDDAETLPDQTADLPTTPPAFAERGKSGRWFRGDFHVHATGASNDAREESTPERIKEVAVEYGLDFVVLTDHSNSTGSDPTTRDEDPTLFNMGPEFPYWDKAAMLSDANFLMIDGNEISPVAEGENAPTGHIGCYPKDLQDFDTDQVFTDRPRGSVTAADLIEEARSAGCFVTINHPLPPFIWMAYDWTTDDYDALEVYNGTAHWDQSDTHAAWAQFCDISKGKRVIAIGGSDNHRANVEPPGSLDDIPIGSPRTYVWAENLAWSELMTSVQSGRVTLSDTDSPLELDAYTGEGDWLGMIGDEIGPQRGWLRVRGSTAGAKETRKLYVVEIVPDACNDLRQVGKNIPPEPNHVFVAELDIEPDTAFDEAFSVELKPGHAYLAWVRFERVLAVNKRGSSISNPIFIEN